MDQTGSYGPCFSRRIQEADHLSECITQHQRIRIQKQDVSGGGMPAFLYLMQGQVVASRKSKVLIVSDKMHFREIGTDHFGAAICRGVIHYPDLPCQSRALHPDQDRLEAVSEQLLRVVADCDYCEVCRRG